MATTPMATAEDEARFVMSWIQYSDKAREPMTSIWEETDQNYMVRPWNESNKMSLVQYPYLTSQDIKRNVGYATLKDPESHQVVESLLSEMMLLLYSDLPGVARCRPIGLEDSVKSRTANGLSTYLLRIPGHYRTLYEWHKDSFIKGTGVIEMYWHYIERPDIFRRVSYEYGVELSEEFAYEAPFYDDPKMVPLRLENFFWDPGNNRIEDMQGCAKRFHVTAHEARERARQLGPDGKSVWDPAAVEKAIENAAAEDSQEKRDSAYRDDANYGIPRHTHPDFKPMYGYCYYGNVPYKTADGVRWRKVEVLCGELVRSEPWYGRIPFFADVTCPVQDRFPGLSPLEVIRFDQDFTDNVKMSIADAISRMVYAMPIVQRDADVDAAKLRRWRPDTPIFANSADAVQFLNYNVPIQNVFAMMNQEKTQMREAGGALGSFQGFGLGVDRASASEAQATYKRASTRPEAAALFKERESIPPLIKYGLKLFQRYLDEKGLQDRVGTMPQPAMLSDIMVDFDVECVGSRIEGSKADEVAAYRELFALGANPFAAPQIPWGPVLVRFLKARGLYEEAQQVGTQIAQNLLLQQIQGGKNQLSGNGNGTAPSNPPPTALPEQTAGASFG